LVLLAAQAPACTFCGGGMLARATLRERSAQSTVVVLGRLSNPRFDPQAASGRTDFAPTRVLKADGKPVAAFTIPQYLPVIGDTPPDYLLFLGRGPDGSPEVQHGLPATSAVAAYVATAISAPERLRFFAGRLDDPDPAVAADAFLELAKSPDAELIAARSAIPAAVVRRQLHDPATPADRIGVLALLLGLCGDKSDAAVLGGLLDQSPPAERVRENLGGFLAALTTLDPDAGWRRIAAVLADTKRSFDQRLAAVGAVRFFQAAKPAEVRAQVIAAYRPVIAQPDFADVPVEDLRRWGWWDLTADILPLLDRPSHAAPVVRRGLVRYALTCPDPAAAAAVGRVRTANPKLVAGVEASLKLYEAAGPTSR
jgi:hypothetical protein